MFLLKVALYLLCLYFYFYSEWIEEALTEHDAEGNYYQLLRFLLHTFLKFEQDENIHENERDEDESSSEEENEIENIKEEESSDSIPKKPSANARSAAAWSMLSQGLALHEITIEPFSLSEILRLHILSSGVKFGEFLLIIFFGC